GGSAHRGSGYGARILATALPLDLRHAASGLEACRHAVSAALWIPRIRRAAEHLRVPDSLSDDFAAGRPAARDDAAFRGLRALATPGESGVRRLVARAVLLCLVRRDRLQRIRARV